MRRAIVSLTFTVAAGCLAVALATPTALAIDARTSVPDGMCSLWTTKQVSKAMKETMEVVRDDPDQCVWYSKKDHFGSISTLSAGLWGGDPTSDTPLIDQARVSGPAWANEIEVAGMPVLATTMSRSGKNREISMDAFPDPVTWVNLNAYSVIGTNVETALKRVIEAGLGKLAVPAPSAGTSPGASPVASAPAVSLCSLLTEAEVSAALGVDVSVSRGDAARCSWTGETGGDPLSGLAAFIDGGVGFPSIDEILAGDPQAVEVEVAGLRAVRSTGEGEAGHLTAELLVLVSPETASLLHLNLFAPEGVDIGAAAEALGALAIPRLLALTSPSPGPSGSPATSPGPSAGSSPAALADLCGLWTADQVSAAFGGHVMSVDKPSTSATTCVFLGKKKIGDLREGFVAGLVFQDQPTYVYGDKTVDTLPELIELNFPEGKPVDLGGYPGYRTTTYPGVGKAKGWRVSTMYVFPDPATVLQLQVTTPKGVDDDAALISLGEIAAPRVVSVPR